MTAFAARITLTMIQGRPLEVAARNVFGVQKSGSGALIEFWHRPEDADPWQSVAHVKETPEQVRELLRKAFALDRKMRDWKK